MAETVTLSGVQRARQRVASCVRRTPLVVSAALSERLKTNVYVKLELFQKSGSFKVRGVFNKILGLTPEGRQQGVVAVSGGNHALAVAYAARALDLNAKVWMPEGSPDPVVDAVKGYGAEVQFASSAEQAFAATEALEDEGWTYIHPFDDPAVIAGQGTLGLELLEDTPQLTDVILGIGGGGLAAGVATAIKSLKPSVRVWGVETEGADCMSQSLAAGKVVSLKEIGSVARSLGAPAPSEATLEAAQKLLEGVTVVSDAEALAALRFILERLKVLSEPAAACTLAAAGKLKAQFSPEHHVVLLLGGGNANLDVLWPQAPL
jgi:threonine dehydratase